MNKRVFFAVNFPEETKKEINRKYWLKLGKKGIKRVMEKNLHITLLFLGHFPEEKIKEIKEKAEKIKKEKFSVKLEGIGSFKKRIIFLGIKKGSENIIELKKELCGKMEIPFEGFEAHATIARNKKMNAGEFTGLIKELQKIQFEKEIEIKSFELMESVNSFSGTEYKKLFSFNLL